MSKHRPCFSIIAFFVVVVPSVNAQFTPVTAKISETVETIVDGKVMQTQTRWGNFYRTADGSELRQWLKSDGSPDLGNLIENKTQMSYKLDYTLRIARGTAPPPGARVSPLQPGYMGGQKVLERWPRDAVEGIPCAVVDVKLHAPGRDRVLIGHSCNSAQYDVVLKMDRTTSQLGTKKTFHQVIELKEIHLGAAPDPKLFDLQGYTVSMP